jgi:hypothetical protein
MFFSEVLVPDDCDAGVWLAFAPARLEWCGDAVGLLGVLGVADLGCVLCWIALAVTARMICRFGS